MQSSPATNTRRINTLRVTYVRKLRVVLTLVLYTRNTACMCQNIVIITRKRKITECWDPSIIPIERLSKIIIVISVQFLSHSFKFVVHLKRDVVHLSTLHKDSTYEDKVYNGPCRNPWQWKQAISSGLYLLLYGTQGDPFYQRSIYTTTKLSSYVR